MTTAQTDEPTPRKPIRLWPGVTLLAIQWLGWFIVPFFGTEAMMYGMLAGVICALLIAVWWLFFSRAMWLERFAAIVLMVVAVIATKRIVHPSIAGGMMGMMLPVLSIPFLSLALVASAAVGRNLAKWPRRGLIAVAILLCVTGGFQGFDLFFVLTNGGPYGSTEIPTTYLVKTVFRNGDVGYGSAMAVVLTAIVLGVGFVYTRLHRPGTTA